MIWKIYSISSCYISFFKMDFNVCITSFIPIHLPNIAFKIVNMSHLHQKTFLLCQAILFLCIPKSWREFTELQELFFKLFCLSYWFSYETTFYSPDKKIVEPESNGNTCILIMFSAHGEFQRNEKCALFTLPTSLHFHVRPSQSRFFGCSFVSIIIHPYN